MTARFDCYRVTKIRNRRDRRYPAGDLLSWSRLGGNLQFATSILKPRFWRSIGERRQMTLPAEGLPRQAPLVRAEKVWPQRMRVRIAPPLALRRRGRAP